MMRQETRSKVLVGVDGSDRAFRTAKYIARIAPFQNTEVVLYNVFSAVPEAYWDMQKQAHVGRRLAEIKAWESQQREAAKKFMEKTHRALVALGLPDEDVVVKIRDRKAGLARDLIKEAQGGYAALAVGRRGAGFLKHLVLGSVALKLLEGVSFLPLVLVGKKASPDKILVAMDGSGNSQRALDAVSDLLAGSPFRMDMLHVIRASDARYVAEVTSEMAGVFRQAEDKLVGKGFNPEQIGSKIITGARSRAGTIVATARSEGYGTIVLGRRGLSRVQEFFMGRVSNKTVYLAKGLAVWVVP
jgi:nucleotide-binding universal stress UspA family protein